MCEFCQNHERGDTLYEPSDWDGGIGFDYIRDIKYCPLCGRKLDSEDEPNSSEKPNNCEPKICDTCRYYNSNIPCGSTPSACKEADKFAEEFVDGLKKLKPKVEPQTDTEIAKAIVHKMIDDAVIAEDAYPDLRQKMHDAVDEYEPQTEEWYTYQDEQEYNARHGKE